jgi:hypothetical protein
MAISANFSAGVLTVTGNTHNNAIAASRDAAGNIFINAGAVPIRGAPPRSPTPA